MSGGPPGASSQHMGCSLRRLANEQVVRSCQAHPPCCSLTGALASPKKVPILYFIGRTEAPKQHSSPQGHGWGCRGEPCPGYEGQPGCWAGQEAFGASWLLGG